jgi:hypothetical protein
VVRSVQKKNHLFVACDPWFQTMFCCSCGQDQYGNLQPNGLLGLGLDAISVPSTLARKGLGPNSFSMCFGSDGLGRISFGDLNLMALIFFSETCYQSILCSQHYSFKCGKQCF